MDDSIISHHGIKGMKWGVRRFQNTDGSYTNAGKARAKKASSLSDEELTAEVRRMTLEKQYNKLSKEATPPSTLEKAKKAVDSSSALVNQAKKMDQEQRKNAKKEKLNLESMSDKELRDRINREFLERQYNDLFAQEAKTSKGREYVSKTIEIAGPTLAIASSALGIALAIKELRG